MKFFKTPQRSRRETLGNISPAGTKGHEETPEPDRAVLLRGGSDAERAATPQNHSFPTQESVFDKTARPGSAPVRTAPLRRGERTTQMPNAARVPSPLPGRSTRGPDGALRPHSATQRPSGEAPSPLATAAGRSAPRTSASPASVRGGAALPQPNAGRGPPRPHGRNLPLFFPTLRDSGGGVKIALRELMKPAAQHPRQSARRSVPTGAPRTAAALRGRARRRGSAEPPAGRQRCGHGRAERTHLRDGGTGRERRRPCTRRGPGRPYFCSLGRSRLTSAPYLHIPPNRRHLCGTAGPPPRGTRGWGRWDGRDPSGGTGRGRRGRTVGGRRAAAPSRGGTPGARGAGSHPVEMLLPGAGRTHEGLPGKAERAPSRGGSKGS